MIWYLMFCFRYVSVCRSHFRWILQKRWVVIDKYVHLRMPLYMNGCGWPQSGSCDWYWFQSHEVYSVHTETYLRARFIGSRTALPIFATLSVVTGTILFVLADSHVFGYLCESTLAQLWCTFLCLMGRSEESRRVPYVQMSYEKSCSLKSAYLRQQWRRQ